MSEELSSQMLTSFFFFKDEVAGLKAEVEELDKGAAGGDETTEEGSEEEPTGALEAMVAPPTATELLMA